MKLRSFPKNTPLALACAALFTPLVYGQDQRPNTKHWTRWSSPRFTTNRPCKWSPTRKSRASPSRPAMPPITSKPSPALPPCAMAAAMATRCFAGQFGSRLALLTNGTQMLGACPGRMDTPSAYIAPETFDVLTLIKGPQTVLWGPGASAGVVRFERERPDFSRRPGEFHRQRSGRQRRAQRPKRRSGCRQSASSTPASAPTVRTARTTRTATAHPSPPAWDKWNADARPGLDTRCRHPGGAERRCW